ncbi:hypothetical protein R3W88_000642 [Solanum pinnatisectum]|uniref:PB1-like domain-containing protein n=1 Tax=Solanum pinnatisectum TaxID=50273 RepID=A0AAV9MFY3_9SOLN|nr:hypothetical protein R3W88_000642 [Solanum pinnatisectum]
MSFELISLRFYHGGVVKIGKKGYKGKPYYGGGFYEFLDVDIDRLSYFELRDCLKELGYELGQCVLYVKLLRIMEIFWTILCHFVVHPVLVPSSLEYGESGVGEGASQNKNASNPTLNPAPANLNASSHVHSFTAPNTPPPTYQTPTRIHPSTDPNLDPVHPFSDPIPNPLRSFREESSKRKRRKTGERASLPDRVKLGTKKNGQMLGMMNLQVVIETT